MKILKKGICIIIVVTIMFVNCFSNANAEDINKQCESIAILRSLQDSPITTEVKVLVELIGDKNKSVRISLLEDVDIYFDSKFSSNLDDFVKLKGSNYLSCGSFSPDNGKFYRLEKDCMEFVGDRYISTYYQYNKDIKAGTRLKSGTILCEVNCTAAFMLKQDTDAISEYKTYIKQLEEENRLLKQELESYKNFDTDKDGMLTVTTTPNKSY